MGGKPYPPTVNGKTMEEMTDNEREFFHGKNGMGGYKKGGGKKWTPEEEEARMMRTADKVGEELDELRKGSYKQPDGQQFPL